MKETLTIFGDQTNNYLDVRAFIVCAYVGPPT